MDSKSLHKYFIDSDMRRLIDHQTKFIASMMGGPASYTDEVPQRVHESLDITTADFAEAAALLRQTLEDFELDRSDIDLFYREFLSREPLIVARPH